MAITATVVNAGATFDGTLRLGIEDSLGAEVTTLSEQTITRLGHGERLPVARSWPASGVFAGTYQAHAHLLASDGSEIAQATAPFEVGERIFLSATVASDRPSYQVGDPVRLSGRVRFDAGNAILSGAEAHLLVLRADDSVLREWTQPLGDLLPGATATVAQTLATTGQVAGSYRVRVEVRRGGATLASAEAPFALTLTPPAFTGSLTLSSVQPAIGEPLVASYQVTNVGGEGATAVPVRVRLIDPDRDAELARSAVTVDLPGGGGHHAGSATFSTEALGLDSYLVVLEADRTVGGVTSTLVLDAESFATADRTPPLATLLRPTAGALLGRDLQARATAIDLHSAVAEAAVAVDGGAWQQLVLEDVTLGAWRGTLASLTEGPHTARLRARDAWDNETLTPETPFEVDLTPPVITVSGVAAGGVYTTAVAPVVEVTDLHPGWTIVTLDGATIASGTAVDEDGPHVLQVVAEDAAGNRATSEVPFTLNLGTAVPSVSIADASVGEGTGTDSTLAFVATLSAASSDPITVTYQTVPGSALAGTDFTAASGSLTFAPGTTSATVPVAVAGDALDELDETLTLELSAPQGATLARATATGTIVDDDDPPRLAIGDATVGEGDSGTRTLTFPVTLSAASGLPVSVHFATADGTAAAGADYTSASGSLTFAPGEVTANVVVSVLGDLTDEDDERFTVVLSAPVAAGLADAEATGTIVDDDTAVVSIADATVAEGNSGQTATTLTVTLSAPSAFEVAVAWSTGDGEALAGADYVAATGTLTFPPGSTSKTLEVSALGDLLDEADETFRVALGTPTRGSLADGEGRVTIVDDDAEPALSIADLAVTEGDTGTATATLTLSLSAASGREVRVAYSTGGGTATAGADYVATSGTAVLPPGVTTASVTVPVLGDQLVEPDETFEVRLSAPVAATLADGVGVVTIHDNDLATLAVADVNVVEGNSGTTPAVFTITLSQALAVPVSVAASTTDGTALAGVDYQTTNTSVTFAPGETTRTVAVPVLGDQLLEPN
ncbi:MAG TPA: Calx-beta domain-containing protein, partial [Thermoanaerobaculia bacterium]|nr:Calx-beta domain-containing protein [Thermoanaerobaculia bacterium]